tara:strand:- start:159 stop:557 length:399 start_codon:yes stop_codon:yes gene_type:complete
MLKATCEKTVETKYGKKVSINYGCNAHDQAVITVPNCDGEVLTNIDGLKRIFLFLNEFSKHKTMKQGKDLLLALQAIASGKNYQHCYWECKKTYLNINLKPIDVPTTTVEDILEDIVGNTNKGYECWSYEIR